MAKWLLAYELKKQFNAVKRDRNNFTNELFHHGRRIVD